jgi:hypothetical protein
MPSFFSFLKNLINLCLIFFHCYVFGFSSSYSINNNQGNKNNNEDIGDQPWFSGTLLAVQSDIVDKDQIFVQPFLLYYGTYGLFDKDWCFRKEQDFNTLNGSILLTAGICENVDVSFTSQFFYNWTSNINYFGFGDCGTQLRFSVLQEDNIYPNVVLLYILSIPTGSYHHLSPDLLTLDGSGGGAWVNNLGFVFDKQKKLKNGKWFKWYANFTLSFPSSVHIEGLSIYGGGKGTKGRVNPGNSVYGLLGLEYKFNNNWGFSMDATYRHVNRSPFIGFNGFDENFEIAEVGLPSSESITFSPAIEYLFDETKGLIFGVWFTAFGRNSPFFVTPTFSMFFAF